MKKLLLLNEKELMSVSGGEPSLVAQSNEAIRLGMKDIGRSRNEFAEDFMHLENYGDFASLIAHAVNGP